jgi:hypothetical protein
MTQLAILLLLAQQPSGTISGRVTDALTHRPIRNALVTTVGGSRDVSGDDGSYTVRHPAGADVQIRVAVAGYRPLEKTARFTDGDFLDLDVELHPLARIAGTLTDKETGEAADAVLSLRRTDSRGGRDIAPDQQGRFEIGDLEPGDYSLQLRQDTDAIPSWKPAGKADPKKPRHSYGIAVFPETIHLTEGERRNIDFRLPALEGHSVIGIVEFPAGRENESVTFTFWHLGVPLPTTSQATVSGPFRIDGLTRGEYGLIAEMGKGASIAFGRLSFSITDHDLTFVKLTLSRAASIAGTVRMAEEHAALPARLEIWLNSKSGWGSCAGFCMIMQPVSLLATDGLIRIFQKPIPVVDGRFQADGIAPDEYWPEPAGSETAGAGMPAFRGLPDGYAVLTGNEQPIELFGSAQVDFVLTSRPGAVAGVVRDSNQAPVAAATVTLTSASDPRRRFTTKSGQNGEFMIRNLAPGKYTVNGVPAEVGFGQTISVVVEGP